MDFAFLHGGDQGSWIWGGVIAALDAQSSPDENRFCLLDIPGCGRKRDRDTAAISFPKIAPELVADIETAGLHGVVLIGHSQAGTIIPDMLALNPDLFRRTIYVSCTAPDPGRTVFEMTCGIHAGQDTAVGRSFGNDAVPKVEWYRQMFCNDMTVKEGDAFLALLGKDRWPASAYDWSAWRYDALPPVPASYVVCLQDTILPPEWQYRFADRLHARRMPRIDTGHQAMTTRPHALAEIIAHEARAE